MSESQIDDIYKGRTLFFDSVKRTRELKQAALTRRKVLLCILANPSVGVREIADKCGLKPSWTDDILSAFERDGFVKATKEKHGDIAYSKFDPTGAGIVFGLGISTESREPVGLDYRGLITRLFQTNETDDALSKFVSAFIRRADESGLRFFILNVCKTAAEEAEMSGQAINFARVVASIEPRTDEEKAVVRGCVLFAIQSLPPDDKTTTLLYFKNQYIEECHYRAIRTHERKWQLLANENSLDPSGIHYYVGCARCGENKAFAKLEDYVAAAFARDVKCPRCGRPIKVAPTRKNVYSRR